MGGLSGCRGSETLHEGSKSGYGWVVGWCGTVSGGGAVVADEVVSNQAVDELFRRLLANRCKNS